MIVFSREQTCPAVYTVVLVPLLIFVMEPAMDCTKAPQMYERWSVS